MNGNEIMTDEKDAIKKLRDRVSDVLPPENDNDLYLRKWLRARNFDLEKAETMFRKHVKFMKTNGLDKIEYDLSNNKAIDYFHTARLGYDSEGSVVRIVHIGASDLKGLSLSITKADAVRYIAYLISSDNQQQKQDRQNESICDKQVYLVDLEGLSWTTIICRSVGELIFSLLKSYEANYPDSLKAVYVFHAPTFFSFIYSWLSTVLPEGILSRMELVPDEMIHSVIINSINPSIVPASVGGIRRDEDGDIACPSIYKMPLNSLVPESMRLYKQAKMHESDQDVKKAVVDRGGVWKLKIVVYEPNSILQWDFQTSDYDIRFGLCFRKDESSDTINIISHHRVESHLVPESGNFTCSDTGLYELVFDNTYSWLTSKELLYKIKVVPPSRNSWDNSRKNSPEARRHGLELQLESAVICEAKENTEETKSKRD